MTASETGASPLIGRRVRLRPVYPTDYEYLYMLATHEAVNHRWRFRGTLPSPEAFSQLLWQNTLVQFIVEHKESEQRIGHMSAFNANERSGWCHIGVVLDPALSHMGWALESLALFLDHLFSAFNFRKLYGEILQTAFEDVASGAGRWFQVEGRLGAHEYWDGEYRDLVVVALYRDQWEREGRPLVEKLTTPRSDPMERP
ncbi:MAG: GNAT family N-acetyltransferase [Actinomycetota bacterium]